jgi:hypothetical protein
MQGLDNVTSLTHAAQDSLHVGLHAPPARPNFFRKFKPGQLLKPTGSQRFLERRSRHVFELDDVSLTG